MPGQMLSEVYGGQAPPPTYTIWDLLSEGVRKHPERPAIISMWQPSDRLAGALSQPPGKSECLKWNYRQLNEASLKLATHFSKILPPRKRTIATFLWNSVEFSIVSWAIAHIRGTIVPLDPELLEPGRKDYRDSLLERVRPDCVVAFKQTNSFDQSLDELIPDALRIVAEESYPGPNWTILATILKYTKPQPGTDTISHAVPPDPEQPVQILFTSGTTSTPKAVPHTAEQQDAVTFGFAKANPPGTIGLMATANFRPIYVNLTIAMARIGGCILLPGPLTTAPAAAEALIRYQPQLVTWVSAQLRLVAREVASRQLTFPNVRAAAISGDVITADLLDLMVHLFPNAALLPILGMTECNNVAMWMKGTEKPPLNLKTGVVAMGSPSQCMTIRVSVPGKWELQPRDVIGDLWISGVPLTKGYLYVEKQDPANFKTAPDEQGTERKWFRTGDQAFIDDDGLIYIPGRFKDIISRGAIKLSPVAMEAALYKLGVHDAQVVGVPHDIMGTVPVAVVRSLGDKTPQQISDGVVDLLGPDHKLENVWELKELGLDEWVYNSMGKISKTDLQRLLAETVLKKQ